MPWHSILRAARSSSIPAISLAACAALFGAVLAAGQDDSRSLNDGVFTDAQVKRGEGLFQKRCTSCHEPGRFQGAFFLETWIGKPLFDLWDVMRTTMPEDSPGSLSPQQYADVTAYFMSLNGFPAGSGELAGTEEAMRAVLVDAPKAAASTASVARAQLP